MYGSDKQTGDPEAAELSPLAPELAGRYDRPTLIGMAGKFVWFRFLEKKDSERCMVIGYDPVAGTWTREHMAAKPYPASPTCLQVGHRTYIPISEDNASVRCYDEDTGQWSVTAPKEPNGHGVYSFTLISVDDDELWGLDLNTRSLICFHRKASTWTIYEVPTTFWMQPTGNEVVRAENTVYVATNLGVWQFDLGTHTWAQLPGFASRDIYLNGLTVDASSVWSVAKPGNGNQSFAVRMDKARHRWSSWSRKDGFPEQAFPNTIIPDGSSAWTLASGECFHLDPIANRWYSVSALLAAESSRARAEVTMARKFSVRRSKRSCHCGVAAMSSPCDDARTN